MVEYNQHYKVQEVFGGSPSLSSLSSSEVMTSLVARCYTTFPSFSVSHHLLMSEDSSSFELVDSPVMVFPANMTSTPEKPVQPNQVQQPDPAENPAKVWGRTEEPKKDELNPISGEAPEEPGFDDMENRFRDILQKKKLEDRSRANGGVRLRALEERYWIEGAFGALVLAGVWFLLRG